MPDFSIGDTENRIAGGSERHIAVALEFSAAAQNDPADSKSTLNRMEADHVQHRYGKDCRSEFRRFERSAPSARENALISADIKALPGFQGPGKANIGKKDMP